MRDRVRRVTANSHISTGLNKPERALSNPRAEGEKYPGLTADETSMPLDLETRDSGTHRARPAIPGRHAPPSSWRHVWVCRAGTSIGMGWKGRAAKWELGLKSMVRM